MRHAREDVRAFVPIDVDDEHAAEMRRACHRFLRSISVDRSRLRRSAGGYGMLIPVRGVKRPVSGSTHVGRSFQPPTWGNDVVATVSINVARTDAVTIALRAHYMLRPFACREFKP